MRRGATRVGAQHAAPQTTIQALESPSQANRPVMISVQQASKVYKVYARQEDRLWELVRRRGRHQKRLALHNVTFDIRAGEVVGIVGRNGAGKTTLLRLISGVAPLDAGSIQLNASLQTILELGTGFHPEFTGRENVYLGGALLGLSRRDIDARFTEIAAFAELGDYLEFPFKTYSLGMQARLTFSLAISVEADILIIDEALSAGDSYFLAKCFDRIRTICESGKTVLFVSHNLSLIQRLCTRVLWLDGGQLIADGAPLEVCSQYEASVRQQEAERLAQVAARSTQSIVAQGAPVLNNPVAAEQQSMRAQQASGADQLRGAESLDDGRRYGTQEVRIERVEIIGSEGQPTHLLTSNEPASIRLYYVSHVTYHDLVAVVTITRVDGIVACGLTSDEQGLPALDLQGYGCLEIVLDPVLLGPGEYYLSSHIYRDQPLPRRDDVMDYHDRMHRVRVVRRGRDYDVAMEQPARWRLLPWDGSPPAGSA